MKNFYCSKTRFRQNEKEITLFPLRENFSSDKFCGKYFLFFDANISETPYPEGALLGDLVSVIVRPLNFKQNFFVLPCVDVYVWKSKFCYFSLVFALNFR